MIGFDKLDTSYSLSECLQESEDIFADPEDIPGASLLQLGILDGDLLEDNDNYPVVKGKGLLKSVLAVCEMAALYQNVPFRRDIISKVWKIILGEKVISLNFCSSL